MLPLHTLNMKMWELHTTFWDDIQNGMDVGLSANVGHIGFLP